MRGPEQKQWSVNRFLNMPCPYNVRQQSSDGGRIQATLMVHMHALCHLYPPNIISPYLEYTLCGTAGRPFTTFWHDDTRASHVLLTSYVFTRYPIPGLLLARPTPKRRRNNLHPTYRPRVTQLSNHVFYRLHTEEIQKCSRKITRLGGNRASVLRV
jgi:hypothetical protein